MKSSFRVKSQTQNSHTGLWMKRNTSTGQFTKAKRSGGAFKGVRRENSDPMVGFLEFVFFVIFPYIIIGLIILFLTGAL